MPLTRPSSLDTPEADHTASDLWPFPGRWFGAVCLILGPLLLLAGALLRVQFHFFAPQQLQAFDTHPHLITAAYSTHSVGAMLMCFAMLALVHHIARWNRTWAFWGGALAIIGLFNRTFSAGVDHMAFQMVTVIGVDEAFAVVSDTYRAFHAFRSTNPATMLGWLVLAIGAWRAGVLGGIRAAALGLMVMLPFGTLKGTEIRSVAIVGLCVALVPLGVKMLREGPPLSRRAVFWILVCVVTNVTGIVLARIFPVLMN